MPSFKLGSVEGKAILQNLEGNAEGAIFEVSSPFPGLPMAGEVLILKEGNREWSLQLIALGVPFAKATAKVKGNELLLEEVK